MNAKARLVLVVLIGIWGTTFAAIRIGLEGIPPLAGIGLRFSIAGALLLGYAHWKRVRPLPADRRRVWGLAAANTLCTFAIPYTIVYWAEQVLPSGLTAILFATFPFFVALFAHFVLPAERIHLRTVAGMVLGFVGVLVINSEDLTALAGPGARAAATWMVAAPIAAAVANVAVKRWGGDIHPLRLTAGPMLATGVLVGGLALAFERQREIVFDLTSVGALLYLAVFGSAVAFSFYFWLLARVPATSLSLITYAIPVVAVGVGTGLLDEPFTVRIFAGAVLVILGVGLAVSRGRERLETEPGTARQ